MNFLLYSNLWMAMAAVCCVWQTYTLQQIPVDTAFMVFVGAATCALYTLHRCMGLRYLPSTTPSTATRFWYTQQYQRLLWLWFGVCALVTAIGLLCLSMSMQLAVLAALPLSLGYVFPVWRGRRLRDFPYLKNALVAVVWAYVTALLPCLPQHIAIAATAERALWIFAIALPFDIRDQHLDRSNNTQTIANARSAWLVHWVSAVALLGWLGVCAMLYGAAVWSFFMVCALLLFVLTFWAHKQQHDYFFSGLIDGLLIFQALGTALLVK